MPTSSTLKQWGCCFYGTAILPPVTRAVNFTPHACSSHRSRFPAWPRCMQPYRAVDTAVGSTSSALQPAGGSDHCTTDPTRAPPVPIESYTTLTSTTPDGTHTPLRDPNTCPPPLPLAAARPKHLVFQTCPHRAGLQPRSFKLQGRKCRTHPFAGRIAARRGVTSVESQHGSCCAPCLGLRDIKKGSGDVKDRGNIKRGFIMMEGSRGGQTGLISDQGGRIAQLESPSVSDGQYAIV